MDAAWVGVIGGAVGAAGSLAGSALVASLAARHAKDARAEERRAAIEQRWFDERKDVYFGIVANIYPATTAMQSLLAGMRQPESFSPGDLEAHREHLVSLRDKFRTDATRIVLFASEALRDAHGEYQELLRQATPKVGEEPDIATTEALYAELLTKHSAIMKRIREELGLTLLERNS